MKTVLSNVKTLNDFTPQEIDKFEKMHQVLSAYNASVGTESELPFPNYTRKEVAEYSGYRELLLSKECED